MLALLSVWIFTSPNKVQGGFGPCSNIAAICGHYLACWVCPPVVVVRANFSTLYPRFLSPFLQRSTHSPHHSFPSSCILVFFLCFFTPSYLLCPWYQYTHMFLPPSVPPSLHLSLLLSSPHVAIRFICRFTPRAGASFPARPHPRVHSFLHTALAPFLPAFLPFMSPATNSTYPALLPVTLSFTTTLLHFPSPFPSPPTPVPSSSFILCPTLLLMHHSH